MRMIAVRQGESDFEEHGTTKNGWLTDRGRTQMESIARILSVELKDSFVVVVSASRRGREIEEIFRRLASFHQAKFLQDAGCCIDDSHPSGTGSDLVSRTIMTGTTQTIIAVGQIELVEAYFRRLSAKLGSAQLPEELPLLDQGRAWMFESATNTIRIL